MLPVERALVAEAEVKRLQEELRIAEFDATVPVRELREENERLRTEHREFMENLTRRLQDLGVPAAPSWDKAFDYLAARLVDAAENDGEGPAGGPRQATSPSTLEFTLICFSGVATWWSEGRPVLPLRWCYKDDDWAELTWIARAANAYRHHTRWVRWSWWSYIWRAPERWHSRPPGSVPSTTRTRDWRGLSPWEVRWCRLRGHPGIIFYNAGGMEPDTRCERCLEDIG